MRRILIILTLGAAAGLLVIPMNPVWGTIQRLAFLCAAGGVWLGFLLLLWNNRPARIGLFTLAIIAAIPWLLPGREINHAELRADYVKRMTALEGTPYLWGGESRKGIDCSGLPRKAIRDALLSYGLRHLDGGPLRMFLEQWWFDASAKSLGTGYRGYTVPLKTSGTIQKMDYSSLQPGDLAVTGDGVHVLAYLGTDQWIQADPGAARVITLNGHTADCGWFEIPVSIHRWSVLAR